MVKGEKCTKQQETAQNYVLEVSKTLLMGKGREPMIQAYTQAA
jgi:hypothetical protein